MLTITLQLRGQDQGCSHGLEKAKRKDRTGGDDEKKRRDKEDQAYEKGWRRVRGR